MHIYRLETIGSARTFPERKFDAGRRGGLQSLPGGRTLARVWVRRGSAQRGGAIWLIPKRTPRSCAR